MKTTLLKVFWAIILLFFSLSTFSQPEWDILEKTMTAWNFNGGTAKNQAWTLFQNTAAQASVTQAIGYVNFKKTNTNASARWAWLRSAPTLEDLIPGQAYSIEIRARVQPQEIPDDGNYFEANQLALRLGSKNTAAPLYLRYGTGDSDNGYLSAIPGGGNSAYPLNTSQWQTYRWVIHPDHAHYDIYLEGRPDPVVENQSTVVTGDPNGIYIGAESYHRCNIDIESVKMGSGDFFSSPKIQAIALSSSSQPEKTEKTITVTVTTTKIEDNQPLHLTVLDSRNQTVVNAQETTIQQNKARIRLQIPATVTVGTYYVQAAVPENKIGNTNIKPQKTEYIVGYSNKLPDWALGGFLRPENRNPVINPDTNTIFYCPMTQAWVKWEESDTFNPAAVVKDDKIQILYRAEDNSATGVGKRVSRLALAETSDGVTITRNSAPNFYPNTEILSQTYEWPGGCEDPRLTVTADGIYVLFYTAWDRSTARLSVATSSDLVTWTRHGPAFAQAYNGKYLNTWTKAASPVTEIQSGRLQLATVNYTYQGKIWKYFMYWGEAFTAAAVSNDLHNWTPIEDSNGEILALARTRRYHFDSSLVESGPPAVITPKGVVLLYNGRNATNAYADSRFNPGTYSAGQMLFALDDPCRLLDRTDVPFFRPVDDFEKSGQYLQGTVFIEGLAFYHEKWYLYYGCADSRVGVAIYDPTSPADGDPVPEYPQDPNSGYQPPANAIRSPVAPTVVKRGHSLQIPHFNSGQMRIISLQGQQVLEKAITSPKIPIPTQIPVGTYILELKSPIQKQTAKIIII